MYAEFAQQELLHIRLYIGFFIRGEVLAYIALEEKVK